MLPVPGSITTSVADTGLLGAMTALTVSWAAAWTLGCSVVLITRPPSWTCRARSASVVPSAGSASSWARTKSQKKGALDVSHESCAAAAAARMTVTGVASAVSATAGVM